MAYYKRKESRQGQQRSNIQEQQRLNINEEYELMDWTERYGVSAEKIREAVKVVGDRVSDVVRYLLDGTRTNQLNF